VRKKKTAQRGEGNKMRAGSVRLSERMGRGSDVISHARTDYAPACHSDPTYTKTNVVKMKEAPT
jgi:hypothetical protein